MGLDPGADREALHLAVGAQLQGSALWAKLRALGDRYDPDHVLHTGQVARDPT